MVMLKISPVEYPRIKFEVPEHRFNQMDVENQRRYIIRGKITSKTLHNG